MNAPTDIAGGRPAQHGRIGGNALRASVLGANDGLVSNLSLVMGVAGAGLDKRRDPHHRRWPGCSRAPARWRWASGSR